MTRNCATQQEYLLKQYIWCRSSDSPYIIAVRENNFSSWPTQKMKTRALGLHVKRQVQLGLARVKENLAFSVVDFWQSLEIYIDFFKDIDHV
jgi:hypothetical protein